MFVINFCEPLLSRGAFLKETCGHDKTFGNLLFLEEHLILNHNAQNKKVLYGLYMLKKLATFVKMFLNKSVT